MTDPRDFIAARLDEDEAAASATLIDVDGSGDWRADERPVAWTVNLYRVRDANARPVVEEIRNLNEDDGSGTYVEYVNGAAVAAHIARHDPARVLREVAAKRRVLERHSPAEKPDRLSRHYMCEGCGFEPSFDDGEPRTEDVTACPELQDLAYIWNDHEDWNPRWCPHVEGRHETDVPELPPARAAYTNACHRCGQGDGWHYRDRKGRTA